MPSDLVDTTRIHQPRTVERRASVGVVPRPVAQPAQEPADGFESFPMRGIALAVLMSIPFWLLLVLLGWHLLGPVWIDVR